VEKREGKFGAMKIGNSSLVAIIILRGKSFESSENDTGH